MLDRELGGVETGFSTLTGADLQALNEKLKAQNLPPLTVPAAPPAAPVALGGAARAYFEGVIGNR